MMADRLALLNCNGPIWKKDAAEPGSFEARNPKALDLIKAVPAMSDGQHTAICPNRDVTVGAQSGTDAEPRSLRYGDRLFRRWLHRNTPREEEPEKSG
jgi:hypothetical protein